MNILARFERYVVDNKLFNKSDKILVAVSGGRDSMLLLWLLNRCNYCFEIAHCNFELRGAESDGDEQLVVDFANELGVPVYVKRFDTTAYAESNKISIQMAARELRYKWFEELRIQQDCAVIAVAQHMNDAVETVLFNLSRGTGLQGIQGILPKRDDSKVVRPLLFLQSKEITELVKEYGIPYRDDSSNFSTKYARNKIRLDIIPEFEKLNADFVPIMNDNIHRFRDSQEVLVSYLNNLRRELFMERGKDSWCIDKKSVQKLSLNECYFLFEPFGFTKKVLQDLLDSLNKESGRQFAATNYLLVLDRETIILSKNIVREDDVVLNESDKFVRWLDVEFSIEISEDTSIQREKNIAKLNYEDLIFPLTIRSWKEGDVFQPLGMRGKKKISDYFIQQKINILDKNRIPIVVNGDGRIIWVVNYHLDDRFKIRDNTQKVLKLVCNLQAI
ncbi:tRNA lysidine(34) synthetase TilS [Sphingobacterium bovistauri]|uniref:tRNA(Ile)-lysidine synthase n=1 Tax=Sphingobacterium bovistauri TaxID=2781959 RepID=A0ABS7Z340_9SPHI|nr:tRNA lysidine(34) synthetase TilS [Sphingobacterium bovistauri]MCA5004573.1 tRNA lysidine(34) synthetase TilS [Sphingobacterium bovistauri]